MGFVPLGIGLLTGLLTLTTYAAGGGDDDDDDDDRG